MLWRRYIRLLVSSQDAEKASERIEEYCAELHPELQGIKGMMSRGNVRHAVPL